MSRWAAATAARGFVSIKGHPERVPRRIDLLAKVATRRIEFAGGITGVRPGFQADRQFSGDCFS
jgi:hypothetical protein